LSSWPIRFPCFPVFLPSDEQEAGFCYLWSHVSSGIEPGRLSQSQIIMYSLLLVVLLSCEKLKTSRSAPGLSKMTHRECRVDCPFPVTWLGNVWEPASPPAVQVKADYVKYYRMETPHFERKINFKYSFQTQEGAYCKLPLWCGHWAEYKIPFTCIVFPTRCWDEYVVFVDAEIHTVDQWPRIL
jgi:hypothetical protein